MKEKILEKVLKLERIIEKSFLSDDEKDEIFNDLEDIRLFAEGRKFIVDSFVPCGTVSRDVISYVVNEVSSFDDRYKIALETMENRGCGLRSADNSLWSEILETSEQYLDDVCELTDGLEEDLEEVFG